MKYTKLTILLISLLTSSVVTAKTAPLSTADYIKTIKEHKMTAEDIGEINQRPKVICRVQADYLPPVSAKAQALFEKARALEKQKKQTDLEQSQITEYYTEAARLNHWKAWHNLGLRALKGIGMDKNPAMAIEIYQQMIDRNIPIGYYNMALALRNGTGVKQDDLAYLQHLYKGAELGNPESQFWLGQIFSTKGQDIPKGVQYHKCALAQGYAESAYQLGLIYDTIIQNYPKSAYFLREYASYGHSAGLSALENILTEKKYGYNFSEDSPLIIKVNEYWEKLSDNEGIPMPELIKELPIPDHPYMGQGEDIPDDINRSLLKRMIKARELGVHWTEKFNISDVEL